MVVRDTQQTDALSMDRYELMRLRQELAQPVESKMVPVNEAPVLPALPAGGKTTLPAAPGGTPANAPAKK